MALLDTLIVAALVLVWGYVLGKPFLMNLFGSMRRDPVGSFTHQLHVLGQAPRIAAGRPASRQSIRRRQAARRRQVLLALAISVVTSLGLAVVFGGIFTTLHVLMDLLLVAYLGLAAVVGRRTLQRSNVVRLRPVSQPVFQPRYARVAGDR